MIMGEMTTTHAEKMLLREHICANPRPDVAIMRIDHAILLRVCIVRGDNARRETCGNSTNFFLLFRHFRNVFDGIYLFLSAEILENGCFALAVRAADEMRREDHIEVISRLIHRDGIQTSVRSFSTATRPP